MVNERCLEREKLLLEWTQCSRRLGKLLDEHLATIKSRAPNSAGFEDQNSAGEGVRNRGVPQILRPCEHARLCLKEWLCF